MEELEAHLRSLGEMRILKHSLIEPEIEIVEHLSDLPFLFGFLSRPEDLDEISNNLKSAGGAWSIDELESPVIEFDSGYYCEEYLRRGRLYFTRGYYNTNGQWVDKDESFLKWGNILLNWVRRYYEKHPQFSAYMSPRAAEWHKAGGWLRQV